MFKKNTTKGKKKKARQARPTLKRHIIEFSAILGVFWLFTTFIFQNCYIPSGSMIPRLLIGDVVMVDKLSYGPRLPRVLQIPFMDKTIWGTKIRAYIPIKKMPYYRLPGFTRIKRGDAIVFNAPIEKNYPIDVRTKYVKCVVALSGDQFEIREGKLFINSEPEPAAIASKRQGRYHIRTTRSVLPDSFFQHYHITDYVLIKDGYYVYTTQAIATKLMESAVVEEVEEAPLQPLDKWYNVGPFQVPAKGLTISMNAHNIALYKELIATYEGHKRVELQGDVLFIDGEPVRNYTFKKNYYYMIGHNFYRSNDSRFFGTTPSAGCVPEEYVDGKATFILLGAKRGLPGGEQWWRKIWIFALLKGKFDMKRSFKRVK